MVYLQSTISQEERAFSSLENSVLKKRKIRNEEENKDNSSVKETKLMKRDAKPNIGLSSYVPLPLDWQQCLDIKSGQIHFYNTRTQKRTSKDPRLSPGPPSSKPSIDLDLNLALNSHTHSNKNQQEREHEVSFLGNRNLKDTSNMLGSWQGTPLDTDKQEMVATVCMRCHMLVMMSKATLMCPNCKFVHLNNKNSITCVPRKTSPLLCCKD